jgi:hypothetical protein
MNAEVLRKELHKLVDDALDRFAEEARPPFGDRPVVRRLEPLEVPWYYSWPSDQREPYTSGCWYRLRTDSGPLRVLLARTRRQAWGADRGRVVVFRQLGEETSRTFYPWAEFVETDDGEYAATVPDRRKPRTMAWRMEDVPPAIDLDRVCRADQAFRSIQSGPSLRYLLDENDERGMVEYAFRVATVRRRVNG